MGNAVRFVFFDLGRVLLHFDHAIACRQMAEVAGVAAATVRDIVFDSGLEDQYERGEITTIEFYAAFCRAAEVRPDRDALVHAAAAIFTPYAEVVQLLEPLGQRVPMGILSNTCGSPLGIRHRTFLLSHRPLPALRAKLPGWHDEARPQDLRRRTGHGRIRSRRIAVH